MKLNKLWLKRWINLQLNGQEIAQKLTMAGLEVDSIHSAAGEFKGVVVAKVLSTKAHPKADRLTLCEVDAGLDQPLNIVCGATNVRAGLVVALAKIGAELPGGLVIKEAKLRGELSQGMLCSASELGLSDSSEGILELEQEAPIGQDLRQYLFLDDVIFDIDLTPNRADCLSVLGVARELSALTLTSLASLPEVSVNPTIDTIKEACITDSKACPIYCTRLIKNINSSAKTPLWIRECLRRSGVRLVNPVVDVTNFVMLEIGQPLHAFDAEHVSGPVTVRFATDQESLMLLDGQKAQLNSQVLVVADKNKVLAIAGVMGGMESSVVESTQHILLESACFNPLNLAGVARQFGLSSDSAQRFERGIDYKLVEYALDRATQLIINCCGGNASPVSKVSLPSNLYNRPTIIFNPNRVEQLIGLSIDVAVMEQTLNGLGAVIIKKTDFWEVTPPSYRVDLHYEVDLIEEIVRLYGYDKLLGQPVIFESRQSRTNWIEQQSTKLAHYFISKGFHEAINYSFVDPRLQHELYINNNPITLLNPISSELSEMRSGMWTGLIATMIHNLHRQQTAVKCFETGVIFNRDPNNNEAIQEIPVISGLMTGDSGALNWCDQPHTADFYDMKGLLQALFARMNLSSKVVFKSAEHSALHPGKTAQILINNQLAGWCGVLHPRYATVLDIKDEVVLFELNLELIGREAKPKYRSISKYPQIRRDLSLMVDSSVTTAQIIETINQATDETLIKDLDVFDVYSGEHIPLGKKSIGLSLVLQHNERTLVDAEINLLIHAIIKSLADHHAITLRE